MYMVNISANTKYQGVFSSGVYNKTAVGGRYVFLIISMNSIGVLTQHK